MVGIGVNVYVDFVMIFLDVLGELIDIVFKFVDNFFVLIGF